MLEIEDKKRWRYLIAVWGCLECVGFSGYVYGWGSLVYVLKQEGIYSDLCAQRNVTVQSNSTTALLELSGNAQTGCVEQDTRLSLVFTIASSVLNVGMFFMGKLSHHFGTRITRLTCEAMFVTGALLTAFASKEVPWTIFPGLCLVGVSGLMLMVTNIQIANLFEKGSGVVVGAMNGAVDSSSGVLLLVKFGYEGGISRQTSFLIIAGASLFTLVNTLCFLPKTFIDKSPHGQGTTEIEVSDTSSNLLNKNTDGLDKSKSSSTRTRGEHQEDAEKDRTVMSYVRSPTFLFHLLWFLPLHFRFCMFVNSINPTLERVLDTREQVSDYTNGLMYLLLSGVLLSPVAGVVFSACCHWFKDRPDVNQRLVLPTVLPLGLTSVFAISLSALMLLDTPAMFFPVFVFLSLHRSFLYTMGAGYVSNVFPSSHFAILMGILYLCGGTINLFQYALTEWMEARGFQEVNALLLVLVIVTVTHPLYQWWACRSSVGKTL